MADRCTARTRRGARCRREADGDDGLCFQHREGHSKGAHGEVEARIHQVKGWLLDGREPFDIVQSAAQSWGVAERQSRAYISRAREILSDEAEASGLCSYAWHLGARLRLYAKCEQGQDYPAALKVLHDLAKLQGLYERGAATDAPTARSIEIRADLDGADLDAAIAARLGANAGD